MKLFFLLLLFWIIPSNGDDNRQTIRFGLTAVVLTENLRFLDQWSEYLSDKMGRKVEFELRKSYREVMDLLDAGSLEFAWICGYPYVQASKSKSIQLLSVPEYRGEPLYHSYIIVPQNSPYKNLSDLEGKVFAFSDPDSNSGFLYPLSLMSQRDKKPGTYFRQTFFTFNHAETVQAVSEQFADGGAVDSYIWEYLAIFKPEVTEKTRIINTSPSFGFPPIVSRAGVSTHTIQLMKATLENMNEDAAGKELLAQLKLDGFGNYSDLLYDDIRVMAKKVQQVGTNFNHLSNHQ